jgi:hypothetical protein
MNIKDIQNKGGAKKYFSIFGKSTVANQSREYQFTEEVTKSLIENGFGVIHGGYAGGIMQAKQQRISPSRIMDELRPFLAFIDPEHAQPISGGIADDHYFRIAKAIARNEAVIFVLPAFPAKSPNPEKTCTALPDYGEYLALRMLQSLCDRIGSYYEPGAKVCICSDGRVFSDLIKVSDAAVGAYHPV